MSASAFFLRHSGQVAGALWEQAASWRQVAQRTFLQCAKKVLLPERS